ncbi:hypothetical protein CAPTEDRAFT_196851 [Capitella teleta]|uniref:Uncharacterized protein n=1 Tax=Capitella teleta TaxID=283909 RepID=R7VH72_CAPTE|nr:hypothetical protein CAPTEDRAFT_196851 [Capitella teleta]|eukprot:ELU17927.1 hypothetical protein CAPTEDRAFT_196851 [Capitella teleta]
MSWHKLRPCCGKLRTIIGRNVARQGSTKSSKAENITDEVVVALSKLLNAKAVPKFAVGPDQLHRVKPQEILSVSVCERLKDVETELELLKSLYARVDGMERMVKKPKYNSVAATGPTARRPTSRPAAKPQAVKSRQPHQAPDHRVGADGFTECKSFFVARFDPDTPGDAIEEFLRENHVDAPQASFRVDVKLDDFGKVYNAAFWSKGILVDKFYNRPKRVNDKEAPRGSSPHDDQPPPLESEDGDPLLPNENESPADLVAQANTAQSTSPAEQSALASTETTTKSVWDY